MEREISEFNFTDEAGHVWDLKVTGGTHKRVNRLLNINILDILNIKKKAAEQFSSDIGFQVDVLWAVCQPQAIANKITEEDFAERLYGDCFDKAIDVLMEATINFTPNPTARENMRTLWKAMKQEGEKVEAEITAAVQNPQTRTEIASMVREHMNFLSSAAESSESVRTE